MRRTAATLVSALALAALMAADGAAQTPTAPPERDLRIYDIIEAASAARVESDIRTLAGFGTRNTLSDTLSATRGIGAARRWIKAEMDRISAACGGCMEVYYQNDVVGGPDTRLGREVNVVNVIGLIRGTVHPNRYVIMSGDIDSRASDGNDGVTDAPGANDNASGMAGVIEAARILTEAGPFPSSVILVGLSGEEQGLWGGAIMAERAVADGWDIVGVLNNDMIGNIEGINGVIDNTTFRVFSEPYPRTASEDELRGYRTFGGEVDGPSRQLARYVDRIAEEYFPNLDAKMIYRLDRFGRGGHHRPFNDAGFPGVRIMETNEQYERQHQDIRVEDGIEYGDVIEGVNFPFAAKLTALNASVLAALAWAPPEPENVGIGGAVRPSTTLAWDPVDDPNLMGYKVYWRDTTAPQWEHSRFVGADVTELTLENVVIDNYLFGVASVGRDGNESVVVFPSRQIRR